MVLDSNLTRHRKKTPHNWSLIALSWVLPAVLAAPLQASSWRAGYEGVVWEASEPSPLQCELNHYIPDFGVARFIHRSGDRVRMEVDTFRHSLQEGRVELVALAPEWQPGQGTQHLGDYRLETTDEPLKIGHQQTRLVLESLRQGRMPSFIQQDADARIDTRRASLTPVRFHPAFAEFQRCQAALIPVNFEQVGEVSLTFAVGSNALNAEQKELLDLIVRYVGADPEIESISIDGHSDSTGTRERNRELSHDRAHQVTDYLVARGVPAEIITTQFHGQRFPVADNRTAQGRLQNRRVEIKLNRELEIRPLL